MVLPDPVFQEPSPLRKRDRKKGNSGTSNQQTGVGPENTSNQTRNNQVRPTGPLPAEVIQFGSDRQQQSGSSISSRTPLPSDQVRGVEFTSPNIPPAPPVPQPQDTGDISNLGPLQQILIQASSGQPIDTGLLVELNRSASTAPPRFTRGIEFNDETGQFFVDPSSAIFPTGQTAREREIQLQALEREANEANLARLQNSIAFEVQSQIANNQFALSLARLNQAGDINQRIVQGQIDLNNAAELQKLQADLQVVQAEQLENVSLNADIARDQAFTTQLSESAVAAIPRGPDGSLDMVMFNREMRKKLELVGQWFNQIANMPNSIAKLNAAAIGRAQALEGVPLPPNIRYDPSANGGAGDFIRLDTSRQNSEEVEAYLRSIKDYYGYLHSTDVVFQVQVGNSQEIDSGIEKKKKESDLEREWLETGQIDNAVEAEIRLTMASIELEKAQTKSVYIGLLMQAMRDPFTMAMAKRYGLLDQLSGLVGVQLTDPTTNMPSLAEFGSVPNHIQWNKMSETERNIALMEWLESNPGSTPQDFMRLVAETRGQVPATPTSSGGGGRFRTFT